MSKKRSILSRLIRPPRRVAVLRLSGVIGSSGRFGRGLEDAALAPLVEQAFQTPRLAAVALAINSPGGSPAQSSLITRRIRDAADEAEIPVIAFCEDVAASGGYMLACAADEIFADDNSILGSIGVVSSSFGFHEAMARLGVERRLQTAGEAKARLDPFSPAKAEDQAWLAELQAQLHGQFIEVVKMSRGLRLGEDPPEALFSGEVWLGRAAVELGLADGIGRLGPVMRERFGDDVRFEPVTPRRGLVERMLGRTQAAEGGLGSGLGSGLDAGALGAGLVEAALDEAERRALWARFGL